MAHGSTPMAHDVPAVLRAEDVGSIYLLTPYFLAVSISLYQGGKKKKEKEKKKRKASPMLLRLFRDAVEMMMSWSSSSSSASVLRGKRGGRSWTGERRCFAPIRRRQDIASAMCIDDYDYDADNNDGDGDGDDELGGAGRYPYYHSLHACTLTPAIEDAAIACCWRKTEEN
ncbi:hypothetical protein TRV_04068 [Trichophyton verrucosum HKI 0517]|uniref:Uncharacterized protein n=1 Tax=Trichophyton verrucosum (strain HKI 0517) TaxID=663202 RepID=D4DAC1_TRIVH|nr:uncharacterized protein TRV_04068 [Trichophyton verrucosum HKI 0517]EFE41202.1 hypothetical protein TRV_04068 [Trichophyton verrucosum HKI 0517]